MAQLLDNAREIRLDSDRDITPPAVPPTGLESPFSAALPRTVAGRQRLAPITGPWLPILRRRGGWRLDWVELGTLGLVLSSAALSVYRLFWAIKF